MSESIELVLPKKLYNKLNEIAEKRKIRIQDLIVRALIKVIEEEEQT